MIVASALLVVVGLVTFVLGIFSDGVSFIYASIGSSLLAVLTLGLGVVRDRRRGAPLPAGLGMTSGTALGTLEQTADAATIVEEAAPALGTGALVAPEEEEGAAEQFMVVAEEAEAEPEPEPEREPARRPAARSLKTPARKPAARTPARKTASGRATGAARTAAKKATGSRKPAPRKTTPPRKSK